MSNETKILTDIISSDDAYKNGSSNDGYQYDSSNDGYQYGYQNAAFFTFSLS